MTDRLKRARLAMQRHNGEQGGAAQAFHITMETARNFLDR